MPRRPAVGRPAILRVRTACVDVVAVKGHATTEPQGSGKGEDLGSSGAEVEAHVKGASPRGALRRGARCLERAREPAAAVVGHQVDVGHDLACAFEAVVERDVSVHPGRVDGIGHERACPAPGAALLVALPEDRAHLDLAEAQAQRRLGAEVDELEPLVEP